MANLTLQIAGVVLLSFGKASLSFVRGETGTKEVSITYTNGTGQTLTAGQVLYTAGTVATAGYVKIVCKNATTFQNTGTFIIEVTMFPTSTASTNSLTIPILTGTTTINLTYNSRPITTDFSININNRAVYTFTKNDFLSKSSDYDNDGIVEVALFGAVTNIKLNNISYVEGTFIPFASLDSGLLKYTSNDTDTAYQEILTYKVKDNNGNISL